MIRVGNTPSPPIFLFCPTLTTPIMWMIPAYLPGPSCLSPMKSTKEKLRSVSYTHLDVYKRQGKGNQNLLQRATEHVESLLYEHLPDPLSKEIETDLNRALVEAVGSAKQ